MILGFLIGSIVSLLQTLDAHSFDLSLDTNNYLLCFMSYMGSANHFFPILDAYIPIFFSYVTIYTVFIAIKIFEIGANLLRGAGLRI